MSTRLDFILNNSVEFTVPSPLYHSAVAREEAVKISQELQEKGAVLVGVLETRLF